jgi:hypothetical protein
MTDRVKLFLRIERPEGRSRFARRATAATSAALRCAVVGLACYVLLYRVDVSPRTAAALAIGLAWSTAAPWLSRPRAPHLSVLLTDDSLVYAEGATCLDWEDVKSHVVAGDRLFFEPVDEARRRDPAIRRRYAIPLSEDTRAAVIEAFGNRGDR